MENVRSTAVHMIVTHSWDFVENINVLHLLEGED